MLRRVAKRLDVHDGLGQHLGRGGNGSEAIPDYDAMEAWATQETNYGKVTADTAESLQPEYAMQIGLAAEARKRQHEPRGVGEAGALVAGAAAFQ